MSPDKANSLIEIFPELFVGVDSRYPFPMFRFECKDGWFELLQDLINEIKEFSERLGPVRFGFDDDPMPLKVLQVKEKYGSLRFYTNWDNEELSNLVDIAESRSATTCEECGKPGVLRKSGMWLYVSCDEHAEVSRDIGTPTELS